MRVKSLEIQGFKSFKDKTVIRFDRPITGIVGPNGCGKSNIVDAFFWVMGEQSYKHIRGSGSDDLIFNGSSKYNPSGLAEVTLVLETDYVDTANAPSGASVKDMPVPLRSKEIAVTRKVFRGGEGEYFINGIPARLKDIKELFLDTGVGSQGYSIIEQGQIGKVINAKPEDRRKLIEEVAGVAKYKVRKIESLRKMDAAKANLVRLTDVILEIERSLDSLERQAQKAAKYKEYQKSLFEKETVWGRRKYKTLKIKLENLHEQKVRAEQDLVGLKAELQVAENEIESARVNQITDTKEAEELQTTIQRISRELVQLESNLELSRRRQEDLAEKIRSMEGEKLSLAERIKSEKSKLADNENGLIENEQQLEQMSLRVFEMNKCVQSARDDAGNTQREMDRAKTELMNGIRESTEITSRSAALQAHEQALLVQVDKLQARHNDVLSKVENNQTEIEQRKVTIDSLQKSGQELAGCLEMQNANVSESETAVIRANRDCEVARDELGKLQSKLASLEELADAYEGLNDGAKAVMDWAKGSGKGKTFRAVADLFEVSLEKQAALEGWLDFRLENIISSDLDSSLSALSHIRDKNMGRAAIQFISDLQLPSNAFWETRESIRENLTSFDFEILGELSDFVKVNQSRAEKDGYSELANRMLEGVFLVRSLDPIALLDEGNRLHNFLYGLGGWSLVDLNGNALEPNGILRGGSIDSKTTAASLLVRRRLIEELKTQVQLNQTRCDELTAKLVSAKDLLEKNRIELRNIEKDLRSNEVSLAGAVKDLQRSEQILKELNLEIDSIGRENSGINSELESIRNERQKHSARLDEVVSTRLLLEERSAASTELLRERTAKLADEEKLFNQLRIEEASTREHVLGLRRELESTRQFIASQEARMIEIGSAIERIKREREERSCDEPGMIQKIEELNREISARQEELSLVKDRIEAAGAGISSTIEQSKVLRSSVDDLVAGLNVYAIEVEKVTAEQNHIKQNLEEKYGPGCLEPSQVSPDQQDMPDPVVNLEMTEEEVRLNEEEVERLRDKIRRLGDVNPGAVEEFEKLKERYDHLSKERTDLDDSIINLQEAIDHINKTSKERFRNAFDAVADRFSKLFPIIFGGGSAELALLYPEGSDDILEAGIDIMAQPPGKKVVNIGLLSGGEKALTAISLIFAIFMIKPSPFCVLDEVDAPLDDANIGKFNTLLKEMAAASQFILITHNKKTMELNDSLYGVTMDEPGVSRMVSIEMN